jgi:hypothetical protein
MPGQSVRSRKRYPQEGFLVHRSLKSGRMNGRTDYSMFAQQETERWCKSPDRVIDWSLGQGQNWSVGHTFFPPQDCAAEFLFSIRLGRRFRGLNYEAKDN